MCTVTIITLRDREDRPRGYRLVSSRDEQRDRPPAEPPAWHSNVDAVPEAIWPRDTEGGGTWIAANTAGLTLSILNLNLEPPPDLRGLDLHTRGRIIPDLIAAERAEQAMDRLGGLALDRLAPFRLVAVDGGGGGGAEPSVFVARWDREALEIRAIEVGPWCFVSSGLGDSKVVPRLDLFEQMVARPGPTPARQDAFHGHRWPDRPQISVLMSRPDARTVSITSATCRPVPFGAGSVREAVRMEHRLVEEEACPDGDGAPPVPADPFAPGQSPGRIDHA